MLELEYISNIEFLQLDKKPYFITTQKVCPMKGVTGYRCLILNLTWCSSTKNTQIRININNQGSININQVTPCQILSG